MSSSQSCRTMALILFDLEESDTILTFTCSGVLPMIANVRMTLILEQNFYSIVMQIILKTPTKLKMIGANDIKKH